MKRFLGAALVTAVVVGLNGPARADEQETKAVLDKAIKAIGGEEKLARIKAFTSKARGTVSFGGQDIPFTGELTVRGLDQFRSEFEGEADGNPFKGVTVLDGDKGWRKFGEDLTELDAHALANEKRTVYLEVVPVLILPLKSKAFKVASAPEEKVGERPASAIKATGPDGKDFTLYFDKESGLPIKLKARVIDFQGQEFTQETTFEEYKEIGGIKKATKSRSKRDGEPFVEAEETDFKVVDKVDPEAFTEPK